MVCGLVDMCACSDSHRNTCRHVQLVDDYTITLTRHMPLGVQEAFTLVLKGHIDLCSLVFPNKTHGTVVYNNTPTHTLHSINVCIMHKETLNVW